MWNKRLPSFIGAFFLIAAVGTITWLSRNAILFGTKAANDNTPKNVQVSNISDTSFTVSYFTDAPVTGTITYSLIGKAQVTFDTRDQARGIATPYSVHYITVKNLTQDTPYTFSITSGDKNFTNPAYQLITASKLKTEQTDESAIKGKVTLDTGNPPAGAIAYVSSDNSQLLSALVDAKGGYTIPLAEIRSKALTDVVDFDATSVLHLQVVDGTRESHASLLISQIANVPIIVLSKNYDFTLGTEPLSPSPVASSSATPSDEPVSFPTVEQSNGTEPQILTPKDDQNLKDQQPVFKGTAVPNAEVEIIIQSEQEITTTVTADSNGNWKYRPTERLEPGNHTITIKTLDASGFVKTITQSFVVFAEGSQFTQPSVSPTRIPTPSPTQIPPAKPTVKPTNKPTAVPTTKPSNTPIPIPTKAASTPTTAPKTPTATATPSPTQIVTTAVSSTISPTKKAPVPATGSNTLVMTIIGMVSAVGIGALLFFLAAV